MDHPCGTCGAGIIPIPGAGRKGAAAGRGDGVDFGAMDRNQSPPGPRRSNTPPDCPRCAGPVARIVYGEPSAEQLADPDPGIAFGGCGVLFVEDEEGNPVDPPAWRCGKCGHEFG